MCVVTRKSTERTSLPGLESLATCTEHRAAYGFPTFEAGAEACRRIVQRGISPAALRLYLVTDRRMRPDRTLPELVRQAVGRERPHRRIVVAQGPPQ